MVDRFAAFRVTTQAHENVAFSKQVYRGRTEERAVNLISWKSVMKERQGQILLKA
jgi:hypothetical protein